MTMFTALLFGPTIVLSTPRWIYFLNPHTALRSRCHDKPHLTKREAEAETRLYRWGALHQDQNPGDWLPSLLC